MGHAARGLRHNGRGGGDDAGAGFGIEVWDAGQWREQGFVNGVGTTRDAVVYHHRVVGMAPATWRFRLRQVDYDGTFAYSPVVAVTMDLPKAWPLSAAYPNPFNPEAHFTLSVQETQPVTVTLYDTQGRAVRTIHDGVLTSGTAHRMAIDGTGLPTGAYVYRVQGTSFVDAGSVMLLR